MEKFRSVYLCKTTAIAKQLSAIIKQQLTLNTQKLISATADRIEIASRIFIFVPDRGFPDSMRGILIDDLHSYRSLTKEEFDTIRFNTVVRAPDIATKGDTITVPTFEKVVYRLRRIKDGNTSIDLFDVEAPSVVSIDR